MTLYSRNHDRCPPTLSSLIIHIHASDQKEESEEYANIEYIRYNTQCIQQYRVNNSLTISTSSRLAPLSINICMIASRPFSAATMIAVHPYCIHHSSCKKGIRRRNQKSVSHIFRSMSTDKALPPYLSYEYLLQHPATLSTVRHDYT
jgi:hypothetical protein